MLTNNFNSILPLGFLFIHDISYNGTVEVTNTSNTKRYATRRNIDVNYSVNVSDYASISNSGIKIGSGTNAPTRSDYFIQSPVNSSALTCTLTGNNAYMDGDTVCVEYIFTAYNKTANDVVVSELGWVERLETSSAQNVRNSLTTTYVLLDRTVLDNPITIPAGETATITYTIKASSSFAAS